jgi:hypothetical protein
MLVDESSVAVDNIVATILEIQVFNANHRFSNQVLKQG